MCKTCGCSDDAHPEVIDMQDHGHHEGASTHEHHHDDHSHANTVHLEENLLRKNDLLAERNRGWFAGRDVFAINLVSSPGAGKTTLLERSIRDLRTEMSFSVIEGDQATVHDAERIQSTGCPVIQINTGTGCHLDAHMVWHGLEKLNSPAGSVVMIENVGNLVCPALFDLGEHAKVVICSVAEGDDKPIKYPHMFRAASLMLLNKIDLLPYVHFDVDRCVEYARRINPNLRIIHVSATQGDGLHDWYEWLRAERPPASAEKGTGTFNRNGPEGAAH